MIVRSEPVNSKIAREALIMLKELKKGDKVCRLNKALYGLRQAERCWNKKIDEELRKLRAKKSAADPSVYVKGRDEKMLLISVYVDDILVASRDKNEITKFGKDLSKIFEIKDLGPVKYCLGIEFEQNQNEITMCQAGYIRNVLERFGMAESRAVATPLEYGLRLERGTHQPDAEKKSIPYRELIGSIISSTCHTGFALTFGGCPISWQARKQRTVVLSSTETEYMSLSDAAKETIFLRHLLSDLGYDCKDKIKNFCDNYGARKLVENPIFHNKSKHIDVLVIIMFEMCSTVGKFQLSIYH